MVFSEHLILNILVKKRDKRQQPISWLITMTEKSLKLVNGRDNPIGGLRKPLIFCG